MEKYDAKRKCPKCGGSDVVTDYLEGWKPRCTERKCGIGPGEHLHRNCRRCGYWWPESCVGPEDAKPEPPPVSPIQGITVTQTPCPRCGYPGNAAWPPYVSPPLTWPNIEPLPYTITWCRTKEGGS